MAFLSARLPSSSSHLHLHLRLQLPHHQPPSRLYLLRSLSLHPRLRLPRPQLPPLPLPLALSSAGGNNNNDDGNNSGNGGGGDGEGDDGASDGNRGEALFVLAQVGRKLESLPADLAAAVEDLSLPRWLLQFGGFRERLLTDDPFLATLATGFGFGIMAKTAAEYKRMENFVRQIDIVIADALMAIVAGFMLVYLPAPTVCLQPPLARNAGLIVDLFHNQPDNALQIAFAGRSFSPYGIYHSGSVVPWSSKRRPSVLHSSAEIEYHAVANAEANLGELHYPIGPMHRRWTKYIELDIHFVLEKVALGEPPVLHVPTSQQADVMTKWFPRVTFQGFRASLCISFGNVATTVGC